MNNFIITHKALTSTKIRIKSATCSIIYIMEVNQDTISHLAKLSNFALTDNESQRLVKDIKEIVNYISQLDELDTNGVEPTYQVFEMENVWRDDEVLPQEADRAALLGLAKEVKDNQIKVPKVL